MLKRLFAAVLATLCITGCGESTDSSQTVNESSLAETSESINITDTETETVVVLSEDGITVDGEMISADASKAVYISNDIIYYESGKDASYGEGTEADAHSAEEANAHSVVNIAKAGTYRIKGNLPKGQIFVDLGDDAENDKNAVVTLILDNADISCSVAPAIFFYNVYECGKKDETKATATVDTSAAGANVIIADDSINTVSGAYVARIYKPGTTDKLHKYDGAFYSKRSMNIDGEEKGNGVLHINATNEGLDSELHLTVNGGEITISSQNDGINTNEDNISVTTINGGKLTINAGLGAEGDGIDSNGYIVINGGEILASSCDKGPDGGIDADKLIIINGGIVIACGNQNGAVSPDSKQQFMQTMLTESVAANSIVKVLSGRLDSSKDLINFTAIKSFTSLVLSCPEFEDGHSYSITANGKEITYSFTSGFFPGIGAPDGMQPPFGGQRPEGGRFSEMPTVPEGLDEWLSETEIPDDIRAWIEGMKEFSQDFGNRGGARSPMI